MAAVGNLGAVIAGLMLMVWSAGVDAQPLNGRVTGPTQANAPVRDPFLVGDGEEILFVTSATNLSPHFSGAENLYGYDVSTGAINIISRHGSSGVVANGNCYFPSASRNGRYVAFESIATNLGPVSTGLQVFHIDRQGGPVQLISAGPGGAAGNGQSRFAVLSDDGRRVVFQSSASNLVTADNNNSEDIFFKNIDTGATEVISRNAFGAFANADAGALSGQAMSGDARLVVFHSPAADMIAGGAGGTLQVYLHDRSSTTTSLISRTQTGVAANSQSDQAAISANGRHVAFRSFASNLVNGASSRIFVRDLQANTLSAVPLPLAAALSPPANASAQSCRSPRVTNNGEVLMVCDMEAPAAAQVYLWKPTASPPLQLISRDGGDAAVVGNALAGVIFSINPAGDALAIESLANNLLPGDSNGLADVFFRVEPSALVRLFRDGFE